MTLLNLLACSLFVSEAELAEAVDLDGDGHRAPAWGGDDCDDSDPAVYPGADDAPYDGIDADCGGDDDFDADGDGLVSADVGGADCDDADPLRGDDPRFYYADCDGDGTPVEGGVYACAAPQLPLPAASDPCDGAPTARYTVDPPAEPDCDDGDPAVAPGVDDTWYDGVDADCGGENDFDRDGGRDPRRPTGRREPRGRRLRRRRPIDRAGRRRRPL